MESLKFLEQFKGNDEAIISLNEVIPRFTLNSICGEMQYVLKVLLIIKPQTYLQRRPWV